jgi:putative tricarboxylic transport membrane protein
MELIHQLTYGFSICLQPLNLFYCLIGVLAGTLVGVLPGIGPPGALALLIPVTVKIQPESAVIMLCGIMYGAMYGGSTTSILVNIPGEAASVITCLDGYVMARNGRAGAALGMAAMGSFVAGTISIFGLIFFAPTLANFALRFGPPEYFSIMVFSFTILVFIAGGSIAKGLLMAVLGITIGTIGLDPTAGINRFTFNLPFLMDGVGLVQAVIGLFGVSEILFSLDKYVKRDIYETKLKGLFPTLQDWKDCILPILRGTGVGFFLGTIPGIGVLLPTFLSYGLEKRISKDPGKFGKGFIAGVAAPEAANNAAAGGTLIPMLSLGVPTGASTAIVLGALMIYGIQPGPLLIKEAPQVFWGLVSSLYLGNIMLLILNLPLIGLWVKVLKIPYHLLSVLILIFCLIGSYGIGYSSADIIIMSLFGLIGYIAKKTDFELTPMVFGLVLGPMLENALRRSLVISNGSFGIFFTRPISLVFLGVSILFFLWTCFGKKRLPAVGEES